MVNDVSKTITISSFFKNIQKVIDEAQLVGETRYPKTNMEVEDNGTVFVTIYVQDDGELSAVYEEAKEVFGGIADNVWLNFDSMEKDGQKHRIDLEFTEMIETEEGE